MDAVSSDSIGYRKSNVLFFHRKFFIKNAILLNAKTKPSNPLYERKCVRNNRTNVWSPSVLQKRL